MGKRCFFLSKNFKTKRRGILGKEVLGMYKEQENRAEISKDLMFLFNEGKNFQCYNILGAHIMEGGCKFSVWAPEAKEVSVVCDKNGWDATKNAMKYYPESGIWTCFIEGVETGEKYKYSITTKTGEVYLKTDPFGFLCEVRPKTASVTFKSNYRWRDAKWRDRTKKEAPYKKPINIYELHFGSFKRNEDGSFYTYAQMAEELLPYVTAMGYTHIELMPVCEYPFDGSWGYQTGCYYAANSRFGGPDDLRFFVDECHRNNIGVIMDWVPAHFPRDREFLARFDGSCLYEHPDPRLGEHKEWGTLVFNWGKTEIHSFLISNAIFWLEEYHMDGLRVDAVSSMLYLDYNRRDGEWVKNKYGGNGNLEAVEFLQKLNTEVFSRFPNTLMIAEESPAWAGVTLPVHEGGLGFNFKWNMGWMNDILRFMSMDPYFRGANHNMLTFSMMYAFSENFILPLSHDEVVHGKGSLINKMYGTYEEKFKSLKLLFAFMYAHPGKKLIFMGSEFGQFDEWQFDKALGWNLLEYDSHRNLQDFVREINRYYKNNRSMHDDSLAWDGFEWIDTEDRERSVISFIRQNKDKRDKTICVFNFARARHQNYLLGVKSAGEYEIVISTENGEKGKKFKAKRKKCGKFLYVIELDLPKLSAFYIKRVKSRGKEERKS